jgi:HlyD family secretion protein
VGQPATVKSKAFPDQILHGQVERISQLVQKNDVLGIDPTADADARVIQVRVRLKDSDSALAARFNNLQVDVFIDAPPEEQARR